MKHLLISLVPVKWNDWNTVVDVKGKRVNRIINNYYFGQIKLFFLEDSQVFYVVATGGLNAILSVKAVLNEFLVWINVVKNCIGIDLMTCCKNNNLKMFVGFMKALNYIRSHINSSIYCLFSWKINL